MLNLQDSEAKLLEYLKDHWNINYHNILQQIHLVGQISNNIHNYLFYPISLYQLLLFFSPFYHDHIILYLEFQGLLKHQLHLLKKHQQLYYLLLLFLFFIWNIFNLLLSHLLQALHKNAYTYLNFHQNLLQLQLRIQYLHMLVLLHQQCIIFCTHLLFRALNRQKQSFQNRYHQLQEMWHLLLYTHQLLQYN